MIDPTDEQKKIIKATGNRIIVANPGSGKTYTLSEVIKRKLESLEDFQGLIAISYTNKASKELRGRSLQGGHKLGKSFFGTLDKFFIVEIIIPFLPKLWGVSKTNTSVVKISDIDDYELDNLIQSVGNSEVDVDLSDHISVLKMRYEQDGIILLESVGWLANYVFDQSFSCRRYLRARYKLVVIDEYQDCGFYQHLIFKKLVGLGIEGVAVGDINQSIFEFSRKSSKYLSTLTTEKDFKSFTLTRNMRCHPSIVNYSMKLLLSNFTLLPSNENRVFYRRFNGGLEEFCSWLNHSLPKIKEQFGVAENNKIAFLARGGHTMELLKKISDVKVKVFKTTRLDLNPSPEALIFKDLLLLLFQKDETISNFIDSHSHPEPVKRLDKIKISELIHELISVKRSPVDLMEKISKFGEIASILKSEIGESSLEILAEVIQNSEMLGSYQPALPDEINAMSIHKSKGLEFSIVFHFDLYNWVMPSYQALKGSQKAFTQDLNLHYVGITRAVDACFLINSTVRVNAKNEEKKGVPSDFLIRDGLASLRDSKVFK